MDSRLIEEARSALRIYRVFTREIHLTMADEFRPGLEEARIIVQFRNGITDSAVRGDLKDDNDPAATGIIRFHYDCGVRFVDREPTADDPEAKSLCELTCLFAADYVMRGDVSSEALQEFGRCNVGYHIWPYWREMIQSTFAKSGLPHVELPFYSCPV